MRAATSPSVTRAGDIRIQAAPEQETALFEQRFKQSGLSVSVNVPVVNAVQAVSNTVQAVGNTGSSRMPGDSSMPPVITPNLASPWAGYSTPSVPG